MPKIGAKYPRIAPITSDEALDKYPTYGEKMTLGKLVEIAETLNFNDVEFWADDAVSEEDHSYSDGELAVTVDEMSEEVEEAIYNTEAAEDGLAFDENTTGGYLGLTFLRTGKKAGVISYTGFYYPKITAILQGETSKTREKTITYEGEQVKFKVRAAANGVYRVKERFATLTEALTWCDKMLGVTQSA